MIFEKKIGRGIYLCLPSYSKGRINMENRTDNQSDWILCPVCGGKTRQKVRSDTVLVNFPLFCPKCKHETNINVKNQILTVNIEPVAQSQSR